MILHLAGNRRELENTNIEQSREKSYYNAEHETFWQSMARSRGLILNPAQAKLKMHFSSSETQEELKMHIIKISVFLFGILSYLR